MQIHGELRSGNIMSNWTSVAQDSEQMFESYVRPQHIPRQLQTFTENMMLIMIQCFLPYEDHGALIQCSNYHWPNAILLLA